MVHFGIWLIWVRCEVYTINSNNKMIVRYSDEAPHRYIFMN